MNRRFAILGIVLCVLLCVDIGVHVASMTMLHTSSESTGQAQSEGDAQSFVVIRNSDTAVIDLSDYPQWQGNESGKTYCPDIYNERTDLIAKVTDDRKNEYGLGEDRQGTGESAVE